MGLDDTRFINMINNYPKALKIPICGRLQVQRSWFRNWYFLVIGGSFVFCIFQIGKVFKPYKGITERIQYRAEADYVNGSIIF